MDIQEARSRIAEMKRRAPNNLPRDIEALSNAVIAGLPRDGTGQEELAWAYEQVIALRANEGRFARALRLFRQYVNDCAPARDPAYDAIYRDGLVATETSPMPLRRRERFFLLVQLLRQTLPLEGMVAECGCFRGLSSYLMCRTLKQANTAFDGRGYRIFDSFTGLSAPQAEDAAADSHPEAAQMKMMARSGSFSATLEGVKGALSGFPGIAYFPGWIPDTFPDEPAARYRFVHLDVDLYQPTRDGLDYFYPRLVPGGTIVCDDYNWPGARKAVEEFCQRAGIEFTTTPQSQAYIVRSA